MHVETLKFYLSTTDPSEADCFPRTRILGTRTTPESPFRPGTSGISGSRCLAMGLLALTFLSIAFITCVKGTRALAATLPLGKYYVANSGNDSSSGTSSGTPWQTLAKLNSESLAPGSSVYLECASVFRESLLIGSAGTASSPIGYGTYGNCTGTNLPLISGADLLTSWTTVQEPTFSVYYASEPNAPAVVFEDNHRLLVATAYATMPAGSFYYNTSLKRVYVRMVERNSPTVHVVEASVRQNAVVIEGVSYINITNIEADKAMQNDIEAWGTLNNVTLTGTVTNYSYGNGIWFTAALGQAQNNVLIQNCTASYNGETGVMKGNYGNNFIVQGCKATYNAFDQQYAYTGGIRIVSDGLSASNRPTNSGLIGNTAAFNGINPDTGANEFTQSGQQGTGIWCDTCGDGSFLTGNLAYNNTQDGIQLENSGATGSRSMSYNVAYNNGWAGVGHSRSSHNDIISNNTAYNNPYNCYFSGQYGGGDTTIGMVDNIYENNICASQVIGKYGVTFVAQFGAENNKLGQGSGNIFRNNSFGVASAATGIFAIYGSGNDVSSYAVLDTDYGSSMHSMEEDPLLTSPATGNFALEASSPAIKAGWYGAELGAIPYVANSSALPEPSFPAGFAASQTLMTLNGGAVLNGTRIRLTDGKGNEARSAFFAYPVNIEKFSTSFQFQITQPAADGLTFTIQGAGPTAVGGQVGSLGYLGIPDGVAVKFDLYSNVGEGSDSTGLYIGSAAPTVPDVSLSATGINLHSGDVFNVQFTYSGSTLIAVITDTVTKASATQTYTVDIPAAVGGETAYVGFTAGTGGETSVQDILSWSYLANDPDL
jgi:parallel beta-helix repeat protein